MVYIKKKKLILFLWDQGVFYKFEININKYTLKNKETPANLF